MDALLQPFEAGGMRFKNRMVHAPTTMNMSDPNGHVTERLVAVYESIAAGGASATIVGATCVRHDGLINERMLGIYDETYVIGFRDVVTGIKNNDSLAGIQLFYGGLIPGLGTTVPLEPGKGWIPGTISWGPSAAQPIGNPQPGILTTQDYESIVESYAQGARRAQEAGFDFVSYHFCHGSLPHVTLSLLANVGRTDKYADRFLFCEEIILRTQALCGKDFPIIPRLCCDENFVGGFDIDYFADHYAPRLHALGIAVLDCTFGSMLNAQSRNPRIHSTEFIGPGFYTPNVVNLDNIRHLKRRLVEKNIDMPLIGSANLGSPEHLRAMVQPGAAEFAGTCRLSLDDPDYPNKIARGQEDRIRKSTRTGASLLQGNIFGKGWAGSAQNATFGRERDFKIVPTLRPKKVVIVGAGSGGLEYAITAKEIGHDVVVFERTQSLGGMMDWAGNYAKVPNMEMIRYQPDFHRTEVERLGVRVRQGVDAGLDEVLAEKPDVVVIATGSRFIVPDVPGLDRALASGFAVTIDQAMARHGSIDPGASPVIYGSGLGGELAIDYAMLGRSVRLLEPSAKGYLPANYIGSRAMHVQAYLAHNQVQVEGPARLERVSNGEIGILHGDGRSELIVSSRLILAIGRTPNNGLVRELERHGLVVQVIGDAREPRSYANAIHEAAYLARRL